MDEFERAQQVEQDDRDIAERKHANRVKKKPIVRKNSQGVDLSFCCDCGDLLADHRIEYGACVECVALEEAKSKHYQKLF